MLYNPTESLLPIYPNSSKKAKNKERRNIDDAAQLLSILRDVPLLKSRKYYSSIDDKSLDCSPTLFIPHNSFTNGVHGHMSSYFTTPQLCIYSPQNSFFDTYIPYNLSYNYPYEQFNSINGTSLRVNQRIGDKKPIVHPNQITDENIKNIQETKTKRNKSFYKEIKDYFKLNPQNNGFLNEIFFLINPKMHVGPNNRDGTFEKRVRLHFIECKDLKVGNSNLKLCWGTLVDKNGIPVFRKSSDVYKIPGNQSSIFKNGNSIEGWFISSEDKKQELRDQASRIIEELEIKWNNNINDAIEIVKSLDIESNRIVLKTNNICINEIIENFWEKCNFKGESVEINELNRIRILNQLNINDDIISIEELLRSFKIIDDNGILTHDALKDAIIRFGHPNVMYQNMKKLLKTGSFNADLDSEKTKDLLQSSQIGSFVIRYSKTSRNKFCIAFKESDNKISQYNNISIVYPEGIDIEGEIYKDWDDVIFKNQKFLKYPMIHKNLKNLIELSNKLR